MTKQPDDFDDNENEDQASDESIYPHDSGSLDEGQPRLLVEQTAIPVPDLSTLPPEVLAYTRRAAARRFVPTGVWLVNVILDHWKNDRDERRYWARRLKADSYARAHEANGYEVGEDSLSALQKGIMAGYRGVEGVRRGWRPTYTGAPKDVFYATPEAAAREWDRMAPTVSPGAVPNFPTATATQLPERVSEDAGGAYWGCAAIAALAADPDPKVSQRAYSAKKLFPVLREIAGKRWNRKIWDSSLIMAQWIRFNAAELTRHATVTTRIAADGCKRYVFAPVLRSPAPSVPQLPPGQISAESIVTPLLIPLVTLAARARRETTTYAAQPARLPVPSGAADPLFDLPRFRGVTPTGDGRWRATGDFGGGRYTIGDFDSDEAAARAYDAEAKKHIDDPMLNFPD